MRLRYRPAWILILIVPFIAACNLASTQAPENQPAPTTTQSSRPTQAGAKAPEPSAATQTMPQPTSPAKKNKPSEPSEVAPEKIIYLQFEREIITSGVAEEILFSPDGSKIAAFRDIGAQSGKTIVSIFDYSSGELLIEQELSIKTIKGDEDRAAIFSPDSNHLIYSSMKYYEEDPTGVISMSLIDGSLEEIKSFASSFPGSGIIVYLPGGELLRIPYDVLPLHSMLEAGADSYTAKIQNYVIDYALSEDGSKLVILFIDGRMYYWDRKDEDNSRWLVEEGVRVPYMLEDIAFQPAHNRWVGIKVVDNQSREIIDLVSGELLGVLPLYDYKEYLELAFIMDGEVISVENGLFFFNSAGKRIGSARLDYDERQSIAISPDRQTVAVGGLKSIQFFKVVSLEDLQ